MISLTQTNHYIIWVTNSAMKTHQLSPIAEIHSVRDFTILQYRNVSLSLGNLTLITVVIPGNIIVNRQRENPCVVESNLDILKTTELKVSENLWKLTCDIYKPDMK